MSSLSQGPFPVPNLPCPVCGAAPELRKWSKYTSERERIQTDKHQTMGSPIHPFVCTRCGYIQEFVNPEDFKA